MRNEGILLWSVILFEILKYVIKKKFASEFSDSWNFESRGCGVRMVQHPLTITPNFTPRLRQENTVNRWNREAGCVGVGADASKEEINTPTLFESILDRWIGVE